MAEAKRFDSITEINREAWNRCAGETLENYDYLLAVERSNIPGFTLCYYAVMDGDTLLAAAPAFFTRYRLATTADGAIKTLLCAIEKIAPKLVTLNLGCLGSFATEHCPLIFYPNLSDEQKHASLALLLDGFSADANQRRTKLLALKDINEAHAACFETMLAEQGFHGVAGMPSAILPIRFSSVEEYLSALSAATRKNMRRKLKKQTSIRIEYRTYIDDVLADIHAMYLETHRRSDLQFEELTADYFREAMNCTGSLCMLYYAEALLIGANLMLRNSQCLLDKYFCMRTDAGQEHNLYFISWFANVRYCIEHHIPLYQSGQAGYETKRRLGSELLANRMYFRHRNRTANALLKLASPLLAFDTQD